MYSAYYMLLRSWDHLFLVVRVVKVVRVVRVVKVTIQNIEQREVTHILG